MMKGHCVVLGIVNKEQVFSSGEQAALIFLIHYTNQNESSKYTGRLYTA